MMARIKLTRSEWIDLNGGDHSDSEWNSLIRIYDNHCVRCGSKCAKSELTKDHIVPVTKGGTNNIDNIQPLCLSCNILKNNRNSNDYRDNYFQRFSFARDRLKNIRLVRYLIHTNLRLRFELETNSINDYNRGLRMIREWGLETKLNDLVEGELVEWIFC